MKIYSSLEKCNQFTAVALGYFDGVHKGHQKVISHTVELKKIGLIPTVFTFLNNPKSIIRGESEQKIISFEKKMKIFSDLGIEITYAIDFMSICKMNPEKFITDVLINMINSKFVVCGFNYRFGLSGAADASDLEKICCTHQIGAKIIAPSTYGGMPISSTRIRKELQLGNFKNAKNMLFHKNLK